MNFYDYIFYRLYKFRNVNISQSNSAFPSLLIMSLNIFCIFLILIYLLELKLNFDLIRLYYHTNFLVKALLPLFFLLLHLFYFYKNNRYKSIILKYDSIQIDKFYKLKGILIFIYSIFPIWLTLIIAFLGINGYL